MSNLHSYRSVIDYEEDSSNREKNQPHVSTVPGNVIMDGVNVTLPLKRGYLNRGDYLIYEREEKKLKVVKRETILSKRMLFEENPNFIDCKCVYVCDIDDRPFFVGIEEMASKAFSQYSRAIITGFDLENGGSATLVYSTNFTCTFSYEAGDSWSTIAAAMNAARTGSYASYVIFEALSNGIGVRMWPNITVQSGGLTITYTKAVKADGTEVDGKICWDNLSNYCDLTEIGYNAMDMKGTVGTGKLHKKQYIYYMTSNGSTTFGDEYAQFMNQATFNACNNSGIPEQQALYDKYNGVYADYADVCASLRMINYDVPNNTAETLRIGDYATKQLAGVKVYDFDLTTLLDAFPAAAQANKYEIGDVRGLEAGNWHQLGVGELSRVMRFVTSRTIDSIDRDDIINKMIVLMDGRPIVGNITYGLPGADSTYSQLVFYGNRGVLYYDGYRFRSYASRVAPLLDYEN